MSCFRAFIAPDKFSSQIVSMITDAVWKANPKGGLANAWWDAYTTPPAYMVECDKKPLDIPQEGIIWEQLRK